MSRSPEATEALYNIYLRSVKILAARLSELTSEDAEKIAIDVIMEAISSVVESKEKKECQKKT